MLVLTGVEQKLSIIIRTIIYLLLIGFYISSFKEVISCDI